MCSCQNDLTSPRSRGLMASVLLLLLITPVHISAQEFGASVAPAGGYVVRVYPKLFYTSAYFSEEGKALNLQPVTGLLYAEAPVHIQYGLTGSLSIGGILPLGWTYQESRPDVREHPLDRLTVRECWLTVQHRWLAFPVISSSSLRIKIPLSTKKDWEDGLRIGDGQVDIFPVYYFDYFSRARYWYTELALGYKYRFGTSEVKPPDELNFRALLGYELVSALQLRLFAYADLTRFRNGHVKKAGVDLVEQDGSLHTFGYGISLWQRPTMQVYLSTAGDWSGRNQYRGMRWTVGITKIVY
jgi:hypothetical protein